MRLGLLILLLGSGAMAGQSSAQHRLVPPGLSVAHDGVHLRNARGKGVLYLADNAWPLLQQVSSKSVEAYVTDRAAKGFTVIHTALVRPGDPLTAVNRHGHAPFKERGGRLRPAEVPGLNNDYWDDAEHVIRKVLKQGLYVGIAPAWSSESVLDKESARVTGEFLAKRFRKLRAGIIWILGDGRAPDSSAERDVWRAMAAELKGSLITSLVIEGRSSGEYFHSDGWQAMNGLNGGTNGRLIYESVEDELARVDPKPVVELFAAPPKTSSSLSSSRRLHRERRNAYWAVFSGAAGHSLGEPATLTLPEGWLDETSRSVRATQLGHLAKLAGSRPLLGSRPSKDVVFGTTRGRRFVAALLGKGYAFLYIPSGEKTEVDRKQLGFRDYRAWWYDPRKGVASEAEPEFSADRYMRFDPPGDPGDTNDWILVIDNAGQKYVVPGGQASPP